MLKETAKMGNNDCFWEARLVSQKGEEETLVTISFVIEIDILNLLLPVLIIVVATHIITFTEWNWKSRKFTKFANVILTVSERSVIEIKSMQLQNSILPTVTVLPAIPFAYGCTSSLSASVTSAACFALKETFVQLNWSVCDFIIGHG